MIKRNWRAIEQALYERYQNQDEYNEALEKLHRSPVTLFDKVLAELLS